MLARGRPVATAAGQDCNAGEQLATHVLAMGTPLGCDLRRRTSCLPPHHCAAHPELFSSVDVEYRAVGTGLLSRYIRAADCAYLFAYGGAWRSAMWGPSGVASDKWPDSSHRHLAASAEGRLAWPQAVATAAGKDCHAGQRHGTDVLAMGTPLGCDLRRRTSCLPPHRCAAHPEPFSSVDVDERGRGDWVV